MARSRCHNGFVNPRHLSRRDMLAVSAGLPAVASAQSARAADGYVDILRPPDLAIAFLESGPLPLARKGRRWNGAGISVRDRTRRRRHARSASRRPKPRCSACIFAGKPPCPSAGASSTTSGSAATAISNGAAWSASASCHGISWPSTAAPRTVMASLRAASCFAFWQVDPAGISLWLDLRNGGSAVRLGPRTLEAAVVRIRRGTAATRARSNPRARFCRQLCAQPRLPRRARLRRQQLVLRLRPQLFGRRHRARCRPDGGTRPLPGRTGPSW